MFTTFFFRELRTVLARPMVYIFMFLFGALAFGAVASDNVTIGGSVGSVYKNAPYILTQFITILGMFGLLFAAAFSNNAALRDFHNQFNEILFSTPIKKSGFFFGRFLGALFLSTLPFIGIYLGFWLAGVIAPLAGWLDAERIAAMPWKTAINTYFLFVLPNMLFGVTIIFWLAHRFQNTVVSFVGALIILVGYIISGTFLSDVDNQTLGALLDPFGVRTYSVYSQYFTTVEKNTLAPAFEGLMLQNRLIWIGVSLLLTVFSFATFKTKLRNGLKISTKKEKKEHLKVYTSKPTAEVNFGGTLGFKQFNSFFTTALSSILKSTVFKILFIFCMILLLTDLFSGYEYFGLQSYPLTYIMADSVDDGTGIFLIIIMVFFSGELVWRDKMAHISEVINATPHQSFASLSAKALALIMVNVFLYLFFIVIAILYQLLSGFTFIEPEIYLGYLFFDNLPNFILFSCFFIFIQVLFKNRYVGYFISILLIFLNGIILSVFDVSSNMLALGDGPSLYFSDMSGFGPGKVGAFWFAIYWILFGLLLLMIAGAYMSRKQLNNGKERIAEMRRSFKGNYGRSTLLIMVLWLGTASFVYYNTQVLNPYVSSDEREEQQVEYETLYKKYQNAAQPKLTAVNYFIDIFPHKRNVNVKAEITLQNLNKTSVDSLFFTVDDTWETVFTIPGARLVLNDTTLGFKIFSLATPLDSGAVLNMVVENRYVTKGFQNSTGNTSILENGTFLNNGAILPALGYVEGYEISDRNTRKKYDLLPKKRTPDLVKNCTEACMDNYLTDGLSDWVAVETVISTSEDQTAIAPGSLVKQWKEGNRNYYRYKVEKNSQNFYSFISARYEVGKRTWNGVNLEVYYDKKHDYNIEMMLDALESSLEYYTKNFGPYYHKEARIIEFPRYSTFAQAFPGTMPYSESFGFIINLEDTTQNNVIQAVIAHEMAHQWWAHQEIPANMQGGTFLTESFSEYSSLMVMKNAVGKDNMKDFIKYNFNRYLRGRSGETEKEVPLYKVENQGYIHYGKGSIILYALQDYIGEDSVNAALRGFLNEYKYAAPPYPNSYDFLRYLEPKVPDSLQYLITDWVKEITLYDFRLTDAKTQKLADGTYSTEFSIEAHKVYADTLGTENATPLHDWVDIGLYADADEKELLTVKRVFFDKEKLVFTLPSKTLPAKAAIDPYRLLIERVIKDNVKGVALEE